VDRIQAGANLLLAVGGSPVLTQSGQDALPLSPSSMIFNALNTIEKMARPLFLFLAIDHIVETKPQDLVEPFRQLDVGKVPLSLDDGQPRSFDAIGYLV